MTYSIVARDPATGALGVAVQSRYFAAGRLVPAVESGVGAVASQAFAEPTHGQAALALLRSGAEPQAVLGRLLDADRGAAVRQLAIIDAQGRTAVHTGAGCVAAAGHAVGIDCSAQANMMARDTVWRAMVDAFERAGGDLADRLLAALEAAEQEGGDLRGRQAAALLVVPGPSPAGGAPERGRVVDLRVDDHPDPVQEVRRLLMYGRSHRRAEQALARLSAGDAAGALAELDACCAAYPDEPDFRVRRAFVRLQLGRVEDGREDLRHARDIHAGWLELVLRFADAGVIPVRRDALEPLVAGLGGGPALPQAARVAPAPSSA